MLPIVLRDTAEEAETLRLLSSHAKTVLETIEALGDVLRNAIGGNWEAVKKSASKVSDKETEADEFRRKIDLHIFKGAFAPPIREALRELDERLDEVADAAKETSRIVSQRKLEPFALKVVQEPSVGKPLMDLYERIVECTKYLVESIEHLGTDLEASINAARETERCEEEVDDMKLQLIEEIFKNERLLDPLSLLQLKDIVTSLDNIADYAESAADMVLVLALSRKP